MSGPYAPREGLKPEPYTRPPREDAGRRRALGPGEVAQDPPPRGATRVLPPDHPERDPRRPVRIGRGVSALVVIVCTVGALHAAVMLAVEVRRWWIADREVLRLEAEVAALRAEAADLAQIAARGDDLRFREHLARKQGYVYPDEVRYVIAVPAGAVPGADALPATPARNGPPPAAP